FRPRPKPRGPTPDTQERRPDTFPLTPHRYGALTRPALNCARFQRRLRRSKDAARHAGRTGPPWTRILRATPGVVATTPFFFHKSLPGHSFRAAASESAAVRTLSLAHRRHRTQTAT